MKTPREIYDTIIRDLQPFSFTHLSSRKPNSREHRDYENRLITLIVGIVIGSELSGDKIDRLAKQVAKLVISKKKE